jgi:hypothetical protein
VRPSLLYKISSGLLLLFAIGHTMGFRKVDPRWGTDAGSVANAMQTIHFDVQGFSRSYWDFYVGFGLFATVFFLLAAAWTWSLSGLSAETLRLMPRARWSLAIGFVVLTFLSWRYFFLAPLIFSGAVTICLIMAAWRAGRSS